VQLRAAHDAFVTSGMSAFAERAKRELVAMGEHMRACAPQARDDLTGQELQIAELARDGLSNPEIGARLFLSHAPSSGTCATCSESSGSATVESFPPRCPPRPPS
jgi:ATP/maltotriose-dependent transcriptional regulator MalT